MKQDIQDGLFYVAGLNKDNLEEVQKYIENNFLWTVEMFGSNGEYIHIQDLSKLTSPDIPTKIVQFKFGNSFTYEYMTKTKPSVYFDVSIDFGEVKIFDLISSASASTSNDSFYEISGIDFTMVNGISAQLDAFFSKHRNYNHFINAQHSYDVLLWLFFFPLIIGYLIKYSTVLPSVISDSRLYIQVLLAIVFFFLLLMLFRCLFNIARWFFPCQELRTQTSRERKFAKYVYSLLVAGVVGTIGYNVLMWFFYKLID